MVIINTDILFNQLKQHIQEKPFVLLQMYSDVQRHPQENRISCLWFDFHFEQYTLPVHHSEKFRDINNLITILTLFYTSTLKNNPFTNSFFISCVFISKSIS